MKSESFEPGWLQRQIDKVHQETANYPPEVKALGRINDNISKPYPERVCYACGEKHGRRPICFHATGSWGKCDICEQRRIVTQFSNYGYHKPGSIEVEAPKPAPAPRPAPQPGELIGAVRAMMVANPDIVWVLHCDLMCAAMDEGVSRVAANAISARFIKSILDIDIQLSPYWKLVAE